MKIDNPLISIIIPAYNAENTLSRCLESILNQSYYNIEIILINDGSEDNTLEKAMTYVAKDDRLKVYNQYNQGVSNARNNALEKCNGLYMCCLDSDDFVTENYVLNLFNGVRANIGKGLILQNLNFNEYNNEGFHEEFEDEIIIKNDFNKIFSKYQIEMYGFNCGKLFEMEIIKKNKIQYNRDISVSEDLVFMLEYILYVDYIHFISGKDYNYIANPYNILTYNFASFESESLLFEKYYELIQKIQVKYSLSQENLTHAYKSGGEMLIRIFYAHYRINNRRLSRSERIESLMKIFYDRKFFFGKYYIPNNIKEKISKFLLINNLFGLFDLYREIVRYSQIKKIKKIC